MQKPITAPRYTIQLSAVRKLNDARAIQAQLALKNIIVNIITFKNKYGVQWHRLRTTSFAKLDQAQAYQQKLEDKKISSLIIKNN